jgi:hypothetical protein
MALNCTWRAAHFQANEPCWCIAACQLFKLVVIAVAPALAVIDW